MSSTPARTHGPARLVVADDETHIRLVVAEKFRAAGHIVFEARDGEEALDLVREHRPDAIITDLQMPYLSGLELCERCTGRRGGEPVAHADRPADRAGHP